jgi:hypothetical protein
MVFLLSGLSILIEVSQLVGHLNFAGSLIVKVVVIVEGIEYLLTLTAKLSNHARF